MKCTLTHKSITQVGPDDFETYTKVTHISEHETIKEIRDKHFRDWGDECINVELHIEPEEQDLRKAEIPF